MVINFKYMSVFLSSVLAMNTFGFKKWTAEVTITQTTNEAKERL